jgi:hypothetical protein
MEPPDVDDLGRVVKVFTSLLGTDTIAVLTDKAVCVSALDLKDVPRAVKRVEEGAPIRQVLGPRMKAIPLAALQAVKVSNTEAKLFLGYRDGERRAQHTLEFLQPTQPVRAAFAALSELLGPDWEEEAKPSTVWSAVWLPLFFSGTVALVAFLAFFAAWEHESGVRWVYRGGQSDGGLIALVGTLGWGILTGLAVAGAIIWCVYAALTRPPAEVLLTRPERERD